MKLNIEELAKQAGMKASIGKTDRDGKYHPDVNALAKSVPVEWLEAFARLIVERCASIAQEYPKYGEATAEEIRKLLEE